MVCLNGLLWTLLGFCVESLQTFLGVAYTNLQPSNKKLTAGVVILLVVVLAVVAVKGA